MTAETIANSVRSASTHVFGRTLNSTRNHHYIIDGTREPKEEVTPVEVFLSAVSSCAVQWIETFARDENVRLVHTQVDIEGSRTTEEPNRFQWVEMRVQVEGPSREVAERYVEQFKSRCPLYRTLASATEVRFTVKSR